MAKGNAMATTDRGRRMHRRTAVLFLLAFCCVSTTSALDIMTWIPPYNISACETVLNATWGDTCAPRFTITLLAIQWYNCTTTGAIATNSGWTAADLTWVKNYCTTNKVKLLMCITNWNPSWDWTVATDCFKTNQAAFIDNVINKVTAEGFDGVDLDFEASTGTAYQSDFAVFIKALATRLHAIGKVLSIDSFPYIWNNVNVSWWKDWVGYMDFINPMQYQGGENDPNIYYHWSWRQDQGTSVGYKASQIMLSFPGWMDTWSGGSMGTDLLSYIKESQTTPKEPGPISVWDCQFQAAGWRTAAAWQALHKVKLTNVTPTRVASSDPAATTDRASGRMSVRMNGNSLALTLTADDIYSVKLFDAQGRLVRNLFKGHIGKGSVSLPFAKNGLASGGYVVDVASQTAHSNSMIGVQ
jgi:hypothetical protein